ncbi:MAG: uroporphyrinogen-III C-methyltransferase [Caldilineaceae bacterium]|nr:uroporphyrinogen-III C-methyltransferase [Caldilineaceae bacterium]
MPCKTKSAVYLVGAGPGDPELITVKGLALLRRADAILYDALVSPELLDAAPSGALRIFVGKRAGHHHRTQDEINHLLRDLAQRYPTVVRLKGGDPFVFGRGSEEMLFLRAAGVRVEIVPGVSSALAAPAYAGIPVTHRRVAGNFAVITGHRANDASQEQPWEALAKLDTLVILMGLANLDYVMERLLSAGCAADTPAAIISQATFADQQVIAGTVSNLSAQLENTLFTSPATIVVGEVAALAQELHWFPASEPAQIAAHLTTLAVPA